MTDVAVVDDDRWLTPEEAAAYLGVKVDTLQKWRERGSGPPFSCTLTRAIRYLKSMLREWMMRSVVTNLVEAHYKREDRSQPDDDLESK